MTNTYKAAAARGTGQWWEIEVTDGLPANMVGVSQCRRLTEVEATVVALIADLLDIDEEGIEVELTINLPEALARKLDEYRSVTQAEQAAHDRAAKVRADTAAALVDARLTMREAGQILGLSHQRIKQLVDQAG